MPERDTSEQDTSEQDINEQDNDGRGTAGRGVTRRFFSRSERFVLQALAGGRCEECGAELGNDFHADHRLPFSVGGQTDLGNAAALCPLCNQTKGARVQEARVQEAQVQNTGEVGAGTPVPTHDAAPPPTPAATAILSRTVTPATVVIPAPLSGSTLPPLDITLPPWGLALRPWQQGGADVWQRLRAGGGRDMLVTATPGSGKTDFALFLAREELGLGRADLLVVVCPSLVLKAQWGRSAHRAGIPLTAGWSNGAVAPPPTCAPSPSPTPRSPPSPKPCACSAPAAASSPSSTRSIAAPRT